MFTSTAIVDKTAKIREDKRSDASSVGENVETGSNRVLGHYVYVGKGAKIAGFTFQMRRNQHEQRNDK